jgi:hypothetical protein
MTLCVGGAQCIQGVCACDPGLVPVASLCVPYQSFLLTQNPPIFFPPNATTNATTTGQLPPPPPQPPQPGNPTTAAAGSGGPVFPSGLMQCNALFIYF